MLKSLVIVLLTVLALGQLHAQSQTDKQGYAPKVNSQGNLYNQLRADSAQHVPHKYSLTRNTSDSTPQVFVWSTTAGDSLILFVNGRYIVIGAGAFVANVGGAVSYQSGTFASMPLPGVYGRFYASTDNARLYFDNGTIWLNLSGGGGVITFNGRTNAVTLSSADVLTALGYVPVSVLDSNSIYLNPGRIYVIVDSLGAIIDAKMKNYGGAPGWIVGTLAALPSPTTMLAGTHYTASDVGQIYVDTGSGGSRGWKLISGGGGGGGADSAIWKNDAHYTGDHTLTMGSHTQTVQGNIWKFDSLGLLTNHYLYSDSIMGFGDSYVVNIGASSPGNGFMYLLGRKLNAPIANYAVSGTFGQTDITVQFANIPHYDSTKYRYLIMDWGVNDMRGAAGGTPGIDTTHFKDSVGRFIDTCIARGWPLNRLIYLSIINAASAAGTNSVFHSNYFSAQKNLCLAKGIVFIDMMTPFQQVSGGTSIYGLTTDGIHPNDQGHELYSTIIASTLGYHTVAQGQGIAVNGLIEANNLTLRGLPYAGYKAVPLGVDTNGHLVNFNQAAFIPNNNDSAFGGNINLTGEIAASAQIEGGSVVVGSGAVTVPKNFTKAVLLQFNSGSNVGMVDALNFAGGALPLALNSEFGGGTVMIGTQMPFSTSDGFENNGKTYLADSLKFKRLPLLGYTPGDSSAYFKSNGDGTKTLEMGPPAGTGGARYTLVPYVPTPGDTTGFSMDSNGIVIASVSFPAVSGGTLADGIYLPIGANVSNAASITMDSANYSRNGNTVSVDGKMSVTPTSGTANTEVSISIPINSLLSGAHAVTGTSMSSQTANGGVGGVVLWAGSAGTNTVKLLFYQTGGTTATEVYFHLSYRVQ